MPRNHARALYANPSSLSSNTVPAANAAPRQFASDSEGQAVASAFWRRAAPLTAFSRLSFAGKPGVFVTSPDLVAELSDARRFRKVISGGLYFVRALPPGREDHQSQRMAM
jgi:hypothetical protein